MSNKAYAPSAISSRGEWHSPPTDSVLSQNLRKSCLSFKEAVSGKLFLRNAAQTAFSRFFLRCSGLPLGSISFQKYSGTEKLKNNYSDFLTLAKFFSRFFLRHSGLPLGSISFQKYSGTEKLKNNYSDFLTLAKFFSRFFLRHSGLPLGSISFQKYSGTEKLKNNYSDFLTLAKFFSRFFEALWFAFG
ncbi:hypothetical protein [Okeania sp. KiyG1]|uniref:hypothetical protein n=1 Tax=Okeania sp. KiyG1 TaxID=2720165 RepID=UPI001921B14D|nr:hypothetical protein [Okeania sp. KiyG1]